MFYAHLNLLLFVVFCRLINKKKTYNFCITNFELNGTLAFSVSNYIKVFLFMFFVTISVPSPQNVFLLLFSKNVVFSLAGFLFFLTLIVNRFLHIESV